MKWIRAFAIDKGNEVLGKGQSTIVLLRLEMIVESLEQEYHIQDVTRLAFMGPIPWVWLIEMKNKARLWSALC